MLPLQNQFDVAHLLGHPAMAHLARGCDAYRWIHEDGLCAPENQEWIECLGHGSKVQALRRMELECCVQAVVLFQASMEKIPYFVPDLGSGLNAPSASEFHSSWGELIQQIADPDDRTAANDLFSTYKQEVYIKMRNPIIHGRRPADITAVNAIRVPDLHKGMNAGWRAYDYLLAEVFKADGQIHEPSWSKLCNINGVPETLDLSLYPDLDVLSQQYFKRHLDGANAAVSGGA